MDTPSDSQRKAWARLSTFTSFVSRICFFKARRSDSDSVNGCIVIPPAIDFTRVRSGGVKKILSTYLAPTIAAAVDYCPYYIHHIVEELCQRVPDTPITDIVDECLMAS